MNSPVLVDIATALVVSIGVYAGLGSLFAVGFVVFGASRIDPQADGGSWGFRVLIFPGVVALWPLMAYRWWRGGGPPEGKNAHRLRAREEMRR